MEAHVRFWAKVDKSGDCWLWTGAKCWSYGYHFFAGRMQRAHRISWELTHGPIEGGLHVLHRCDNPPCVNPDHLFLGTPLDNARDRETKGRRRAPSGDDHYMRRRLLTRTT